MAATVERSETLLLSEHGLAAEGPHLRESDDRAALHARARAQGGRSSPRAGRSSSTPVATPAARRRTSSSSASPAPRSASGGATSTSRLEEENVRRPAREGRRVPRAAADALRRRRLRRRRSRAPHRRARDHRPRRTTRCSRRRCSSIRPTRSSTTFEPEALVLHAPAVEAEPGGGRHAQRHVHRPAPDAHRGADRRDVLRRRDQEVDLHGDERPAAARGRLPDALLGERRRRRPRGDLLRALGHREDDAVGRPGAPADRRRRARLGRQRASSTSRAAATRR